MTAAVNILLTIEIVGDVSHSGLAAHNLGSSHNGINDGLITGAAAYVLVSTEPLANFFTGRIGVLLKQAVCRNDKAGGAETALDTTVGDPCLLQGMQVLSGAEALNGEDLRILGDVLHLAVAGTNYLTVEDEGASAANADATAYLGTRETETAQDNSKGVLLRVAKDEALHTVDRQSDSLQFFHFYTFAFIELFFKPQCGRFAY